MVRRLLLFACVAMLQLFTIDAHSQCGDSIDLSTWIKEGIAANGTWTVGGGGNSVTQSINGDPTFYVSPDSFINVRISGDIRVNTTGDDDWIGFVFGYQDPDAGNNTNYDFYLFDWKQADQNFNGFFGPEGYSLSRMNGPITNLAQAFSSKAGPFATLLASQYGNTLGWNDLQTYSFTLTYTNTRVVININGDTIFDVFGCFPPGRFGFYNYSQSDVSYSNFSYQVAAAFDVLTPNVCLGDTAEFIAVSDSCENAAGIPENNTLVAWDWDFGDGFTSNDTNGSHLYNAAGTYTVRLIVTDYLNCKDTAYSTVEVHDTIIILDLDTTICPHDTLLLDAGTFNTYQWNTGETTQSIQVNAAGEYFLTVTNAYGCYKSDTVDIDHHPTPLLDLGSDTLICNGDTVIFYANGPDTTVTYLWNTGSTIDSLVTSTPGTYYCIVTDTNTCYSTDTVLVTNFAQPIVSPPNPVLCFGDTISISASGANTYQWYPNYAISSTIGTTIQTYTTVDTIYNVIGTDTNGCVDTSSFFVDVLDLPTVSFSGGDSICFGDSLPIVMTFTGTGPWNLVYANSGDTFIISGITNYVDSFMAMDSGSYVPISVTDANCTGYGGDSTILFVQPLPIITLVAESDTICADDSISIIASGAATYAWSPGLGLNDSTIASVLASPPATTIYTVVGTSAFGCVDSNTIDIEVKPLPVITLNLTSDTICLEDTIQLTASGALSYLWVPQPVGSNLTGASINVSPTQFTTYEVFATAANGCVDSAEIDVTVDTLPVIYILPEDTAFCIYDTAQLSVHGASTYTWFPSASLSSSTGNSVMAFPIDTASYEVVGTDLNGCIGRDTIDVTIFPLPNVVVAPQYTEVCFGLTDTLTVTGAQSYTWSPGYNLSATTGSSVVAFVDVDTSYVVEGLDANGCINTDTVVVNMLELPSLQLVADTDSVCLGTTTQLEATGATTYQWAPVAGLNAYNQASVIAQPTTTSTYEVYGTDVFGCVDSAETIIVVLPLPIIPISPMGGGICVGESRQMVITNGYDYQWSPTTYLQLDGNNNDTVIATPPDTTVYTITATDGFECVSDTTYKLAVTPLPVLTITMDDPTICLNGSTKLHATGANTYVWGPSINLAGALTANPTVSPDSAVEYFVTATGPGGCQSIGSIEVEVFPVPNYSAGEDQEICIGDTTQLKAKGGVSYSWQPFIGINSATIANPTCFTNTSRGYTVTVTDGNGCTYVDGIFVEVHELPIVDAGVRATICEGESYVIGGNPTGPVGSSFEWSPSDNLISPVTANPEASPTDTTLYTVVVTDLNGCVNSGKVRLNVKPKPELELLDKEKYICYGDSGAVYVTDGLLNYSWSPEQWVLNPHKPETFIFPPSTSIMSVTAEGFNGCLATIEFEMEVKPLPEVHAGEDVEICEGDTISVFGSSEAKKTIWSPAEIVAHSDSLSTIAYPVSRTNLFLTATDQFGCVNTDDVLIYVYPFPHADAGENIDNCHIETIFLGTEYTADPENYITWEPSENLSDPHAQNPYVLTPDNMTYYLTVETPQGCVSTDSIYVEADCYSRVYIPSSFSPNNDDVNDLFLISTHRIQNPYIVIRDKWGHVVFETNDIAVGWDGRVNGVDGAIGVYYFELVYETESGKVQGEKSTLTLIR